MICFSSSVSNWPKKPVAQGIISSPQTLNKYSATNQLIGCIFSGEIDFSAQKSINNYKDEI